GRMDCTVYILQELPKRFRLHSKKRSRKLWRQSRSRKGASGCRRKQQRPFNNYAKRSSPGNHLKQRFKNLERRPRKSRRFHCSKRRNQNRKTKNRRRTNRLIFPPSNRRWRS